MLESLQRHGTNAHAHMRMDEAARGAAVVPPGCRLRHLVLEAHVRAVGADLTAPSATRENKIHFC